MARWILGIFFVLVFFGSLIGHEYLPALFLLLIAFLLIPPVEELFENLLKIKLPGSIIVVLIICFFFGFGITVPPHTSNINSGTSAADSNTGTTQNAVYNDADWIAYVQDSTKTISADLNDISTSVKEAANTGNYDGFLNQCQGLKFDTDLILAEDTKYKISPKYQEAHKSWISGVKDMNYAGEYGARNAGIKKNLDWNIDDGLKDVENHILDGKDEIQRAAVLIHSSS